MAGRKREQLSMTNRNDGMIAIDAKVIVTEDGKIALEGVNAPPQVTPGEHEAVIVIERHEARLKQRKPITFSAHDVGTWPENLSLRREDIYGDDGR
jgi:hypothetical protein